MPIRFKSHPRHLERYSLEPRGLFVPGGRADRTCVVIDIQRTATSERADLFLRVPPDRDFKILWVLRALLAGQDLDPTDVEQQTGLPVATWQDLLDQMRAARYGVIIYGAGISRPPRSSVNPAAVMALVSELNAYARFVALPLIGGGNPTGADNVLLWQTGYPGAVDLSRGYPRYLPHETSVTQLLARREVDAALIVASDPAADLPSAAAEYLAKIPSVVLDSEESLTLTRATVAFATARPGIETGGTVHRSDGVALPLRPTVAAQYPTDVEILNRLEARIRELTGGVPISSPAKIGSQ